MAIVGLALMLTCVLVGVALLRAPKTTALTLDELQQHLSFATRYLGNRSTAEIRFPGLRGALLLDTRTHSQRPKSCALRATSGYLGHGAVDKISDEYEARGIENVRRMTARRDHVSDVRIIWRVDEEPARAAMQAIAACCDALGLEFAGPFTLTYRGQQDPLYQAREGDPQTRVFRRLRNASSWLVALLLRQVRPSSG